MHYMNKAIRRTSLLVATLALITACTQASTTTTSQKPTSSQKPTTPTTQPAEEKTLTSISVATTPSKTEYELGTKLDLAGAQLKVTYSDGSTKTVPIDESMISSVDMNTSGSKTVTVTYKNKTATFKITVKEKPVVVPVSVHFAKDMDHVTIGGRLVLAPVVSPAGVELVWHSSDEAVATVSNGVVSAKAYGNVVISVTQKGSDEVLASTKVYVLRQTAAPVNWAKYKYIAGDNEATDVLVMLSGGTMPNFTEKGINNGVKQLIIDAAVGEDQLTLSGLTADHVEVRGGSATSIIFSNCIIKKLTVAKVSDKPVRVELNNETKIDEVALNSAKAILTAKVAVPVVKVVKEANIQATETIKKVETAANVKLEAGAKVENLEVKSTVEYTYTKAVVDEEGNVTTPEVAQKTESLGTADKVEVEVAGTVEKVVNEQPNTKIAGTGTVELVETGVDMTLGMDSQVVATADETIISNTDETAQAVELSAGDRINYAEEKPEKTDDNTIAGPIAVGDHVEVYSNLDLAQALYAAAEKQDIVLASNIADFEYYVNVTKYRSLDLNGKALGFADSINCQFAFDVKDAGQLVIKDSSAKEEGKIEFANTANHDMGIRARRGGKFTLESGTLTVRHAEESEGFQVIQALRYGDKPGTIEIKGGKIVDTSANAGLGVVVYGEDSTLKMSGGEINIPHGVAISGHGKAEYAGTVIDISGGTIIGENVAIYHPQDGKLNISGGTIKANDAIYAKSGTINITGGTIESTGTYDVSEIEGGEFTPNGSGTNPVGAAIVLWGQDGYTGNIAFNMQDAKVTGECGIYETHRFRTDGENIPTTEINLSGYTPAKLAEMKIHSSMPINVTEGTKKYLAASTEISLANALYAAAEKQDIVLTNDITDFTYYVNVKKYRSLDLNGKNLGFADSIAYNFAFAVKDNGQLVIKDSSADNKGKIEFSNTDKHDMGIHVYRGGKFTLESGTLTVRHAEESEGFQVIRALSETDKPGTIEIKGGKVVDTSENAGFGVVVYGKDSKLNMSGGEIDIPHGAAISGYGVPNYAGTIIDITGGKINALVGIYHPQDGQLNISGGEITGVNSGIEIRAGDLVVTDGKITATSTEATTSEKQNSGPTTVGAGIAVVQHNTKLPINVTISGGKITGTTALYEKNVQENDPYEGVKIEVTGGEFSTEPDATHIAEGYEATKSGEGEDAKWTVSEKAGE